MLEELLLRRSDLVQIEHILCFSKIEGSIISQVTSFCRFLINVLPWNDGLKSLETKKILRTFSWIWLMKNVMQDAILDKAFSFWLVLWRNCETCSLKFNSLFVLTLSNFSYMLFVTVSSLIFIWNFLWYYL